MFWKHSGEAGWSTSGTHEVPAGDVKVGSTYKCQKMDDSEVVSGVIQIISGTTFSYYFFKNVNFYDNMSVIYHSLNKVTLP